MAAATIRSASRSTSFSRRSTTTRRKRSGGWTSRSADRDVHPPDRFRLVVVDLRENDVLLEAERIVAAAIEALRVKAAEVAHARQRDVDQAVEELKHPGLAQRHLAADRLALAQLVGRDRLARFGDHGLLPGNQRKIA